MLCRLTDLIVAADAGRWTGAPRGSPWLAGPPDRLSLAGPPARFRSALVVVNLGFGRAWPMSEGRWSWLWTTAPVQHSQGPTDGRTSIEGRIPIPGTSWGFRTVVWIPHFTDTNSRPALRLLLALDQFSSSPSPRPGEPDAFAAKSPRSPRRLTPPFGLRPPGPPCSSYSALLLIPSHAPSSPAVLLLQQEHGGINGSVTADAGPVSGGLAGSVSGAVSGVGRHGRRRGGGAS